MRALRFKLIGLPLAAALGLAGSTLLLLPAGAVQQVREGNSPSLAASDAGQRLVLSAPVAPSVTTDPPIFGVAPGGLDWQLRHGHVRVGAGGAIQANIDGLVVTTTGVNPLPYIAATVYCDGVAVATTAPVPFSSIGDAQIHAVVGLPASCAAPAVLFNPARSDSPSSINTSAYIAFGGTA